MLMARAHALIKGLFAIVLLAAAGLWLAAHYKAVNGEAGPALTRDGAVALAERFIRENGYTDAPASEIKRRLDPEALEWTSQRSEELQLPRNTLKPNAIGIKSTDVGWGVAFEYVSDAAACRVVTMAVDGSGIRMQHQNGICEYWAGFDLRIRQN